MRLAKEEIYRKLLHLSLALLMPAGIFYLPKIPGVGLAVPPILLVIIFVISITVELLRFRLPAVQKVFENFFGSMLRSEERHSFTGSTYVVGSALLCSVLFYSYPHVSFLALTTFIVGDAAAALIGQSIGRIRIGRKSLEGSLGCFLTCITMYVWLFPVLPMLLDIWNGKVPGQMILAASLSVTVFELIPLKVSKHVTINDNLAVPVITGILIVGLSKII